MTGCLRAMFLLVLLGTATSAAGHEIRLARFLLAAGAAPDTLQLEIALTPDADVSAPLRWPEGCAAIRAAARDKAQQLAFDLHCANGVEGVGPVQTEWGQDGAILTVRAANGVEQTQLLAGTERGVALPLALPALVAQTQSPAVRALRYLSLGSHHVLIGWDHLAFVLTVTLLVRGRQIVWLVTAFTVGHSLSLALAALDIVRLPVAPVEALIALSVVYMAREALQRPTAQSGRGASALRRHGAVVAAFGLLHGLGFASVLGDLTGGVAVSALALLCFNLGVEFGQLVFVLALLGSVALCRRAGLAGLWRGGLLRLAGGLGLYWVVVRVAAF